MKFDATKKIRKMSEKTEKSKRVPTLYVYSLKNFVKQMDLTVTSLDKMCYLRLLPPTVLSDIYRGVSQILSPSRVSR